MLPNDEGAYKNLVDASSSATPGRLLTKVVPAAAKENKQKSRGIK